VELEVLGWFKAWVGYPAEAAGSLTSGGSAANMTALACAREAKAGAMRDDLVLYASDQAHSSIARAARLLGFRPDQVRVLPTENDLRLAPESLAAAIEADLRAGRSPLAVTANAGSTNTGITDPLPELAEVCRKHGVWLHVDAAYGGFAALSERGREQLRGLELADSLTLDPHKWLGVPVDAGCALVRSPDDLREAFSTVPPYLRQGAGAEVGTFAEHGLEQTRPFRALKTWATIAARGRDGIADQVVRANALARELAALIEREPSLELAAAPETSIVAFRAQLPGCAPDRLEAVNRALPEAVQARGRAFVTGTVYEGRETMRACILHPGTTTADLATLVAEVIAAAGDLAAAPS
jgi:glutamate/tyrosine decarboxylase-like PLP-dependent enzyme